MGKYDIAFKRLAGRRPADFAWLILRAQGLKARSLPAGLTAMQWDVDFVLRVSRSPREPFVLHLEFERRLGPDVGPRLLECNVLLHRREERLPVISAVLLSDGPAPAGGVAEYRYAAEGFEALAFRYQVVSLPSLDAREMLEVVPPGILPLLPLTRGGVEPRLHAETLRRIERLPVPREVRLDFLTAASLFAEWKGLVTNLVRRMDMRESPLYQEIIAEGEAKGRAEGRAEACLRFLEGRFGKVPRKVRDRMLRETSIERLDELIDLAVSAKSLKEFAAQLES